MIGSQKKYLTTDPADTRGHTPAAAPTHRLQRSNPMRIIAGSHRGRRILGPRDADTTRPITDRVKTALFDRLSVWRILGPDAQAGLENQPATALDIFAGTGSLGLEALSRGIDRCIFVEQDRTAVDRLKRNLDDLELADRAQVLQQSALRPGWARQLVRDPVRVAFVDPPYAMLAKGWPGIAALLTDLAAIAEPDGVLVLRAEKFATVQLVPGWQAWDRYTYGNQVLYIYQQPQPTNPA